MTISAESLADNVTQLTSFPDVAFRINEKLADDNSGASDIGALIEPDPALSAALLKIANSAMYSFGGTISDIDRAITVVGLREVRDLAFGICASSTFNGIPNDLVSVEDFWEHSLYCASAARLLAKKANVCHGDSLFTAGLLHDIGHLVMFSQCPEQSLKSLQLSIDESDGLSPYLSERRVFGFDHMDVGAALAAQWRLPDVLCQCIQFHHAPFAAGVSNHAAVVVHLANSLAVLAELDSHDLNDAPVTDPRAFDVLGLDQSIIEPTIAESHDMVADLKRVFIAH